MQPAPRGILAPLAEVIDVNALGPEANALIKKPKNKPKRSEASILSRKEQDRRNQQRLRDKAKIEAQKISLTV